MAVDREGLGGTDERWVLLGGGIDPSTLLLCIPGPVVEIEAAPSGCELALIPFPGAVRATKVSLFTLIGDVAAVEVPSFTLPFAIPIDVSDRAIDGEGLVLGGGPGA